MKNLRLFLLTIIVSTHPYLLADPYQTGVASYQQLAKEYYLAAIITEQPTESINELYELNGVKTMVLRITTERWSLRNFHNRWRQDISINNNLVAEPELAKAIDRFIHFPKETLRFGDEIRVVLNADGNSEVQFNKQPVFTDAGAKLFYALLNTWLGEVPPSRLFQSDILTQPALVTSERDANLERFTKMAVAPERLNLVSQWRAKEQQTIAAEKEAARLEQERKDKAEKLKQQLAEEKRLAEIALANSKKQAANLRVENKPAVTVKATNNPSKKQSEQAKLNAEKKLQTYMKDLYQWAITEQIAEQLRYPLWAKEFRATGAVSIEFVVKANGDLMGIKKISPSDSGILGQALQTSLIEAAPFGAFSQRLNAEELVLTVEHEFNPNTPSVVPPKPTAPADLQDLIALVGG